jgi:hypothetical protein
MYRDATSASMANCIFIKLHGERLTKTDVSA